MSKSKARAYVTATRPWSFTCSSMPALLGGVTAYYLYKDTPGFSFSWVNFFLTVVGMIAAQAACNLINDYYDYKMRCDHLGNLGVRNPFLQPALSHRTLLVETLSILFVAFLVALYFIITVNLVILWLVLFGLFTCVFYTAPPISLKYHALGDLFIILAFGFATTFGAFYVQAWTVFSFSRPELLVVLLYAVPVAFMGDAMLNANNTRDIGEDRSENVLTFAGLVGETLAWVYEHFLVVGSFLVSILLILFFRLTPLTLVTLLAVPAAHKLLYKMRNRASIDREAYARVDLDSARVHLIYCSLYVCSMALGALLL